MSKPQGLAINEIEGAVIAKNPCKGICEECREEFNEEELKKELGWGHKCKGDKNKSMRCESYINTYISLDALDAQGQVRLELEEEKLRLMLIPLIAELICEWENRPKFSSKSDLIIKLSKDINANLKELLVTVKETKNEVA